METLEIIRVNLLSPLVLAFVLGIIATLVKSDVEIPEPIYKFLSLYLLFSIGIRGGVELATVSFAEFWLPAVVTMFMAVAIPTWSYLIVRSVGRMDVANAAAIAAHYGSVSSVTFVAAISLMESLNQPFEAYIPTLAALAEWGIIVGLFIARWRMGTAGSIGDVVRDTLAGRSVILLMGGLVLGLIIGEDGYAPIAPVFTDLFRGFLTIFLLEMGMVAARQLREFAKVGPFMVGFGTVMPVINGIVGITLGTFAGMSLGGAFILGCIAASASYIDAPAAVRATIPQANPSIYLTASLGITLPFNLIVGFPIYFAYTSWLHGLVNGGM
ncbi:MAG: sodium-dependent bicarbonate transport family permease [Chloroflexaceae bacterium]|nr:sodium-dependent bicarbonate transport family permease [Chloroflexaceae bacterium]NJL32692.1 sodium-dependent bicarbonate transport family permease [Chloroflexaceae bacterium]NJO05139.1 sodium-dependent bicarbonate transport family permease [Chloroflexaceae bacterium]